MILNFLGPDNTVVRVKVGEDRRLWMSGRMTNGAWMAFTDLVLKSKQDGRAAAMTERIISCTQCLPGRDDLAFYVRYEFEKAGLRFAGMT